jgi:thioredoxin 1
MLPLNDSNYLSVVNKGIVVIDFMADWCRPCKSVSEILNLLEPKYRQILFTKVNVDQAPSMAAA